MTCPECRGKTSVTETRESPRGVRRRRRCRSCGYRFTTFECAVVQIVTQRATLTADIPDATEIAREVVGELEDRLALEKRLDALPSDVVEALLEEASAHHVGIENGHQPELPPGSEAE